MRSDTVMLARGLRWAIVCTVLAAVALSVCVFYLKHGSSTAELVAHASKDRLLRAQQIRLKSLFSSLRHRSQSLKPMFRHDVSNHFSIISSFLKDQSALDNSDSLPMFKVKENRNLADGYGLAAQLQENENRADGSSAEGSSLTKALKSADAALAAAGFGNVAHRRDALIGRRRSHAIMNEMALSGGRVSPHTDSLKRALLLSQRELDKVLHHDNDRADPLNMGLSKMALNSVTEGMESGLRVYRKDPIVGGSTGSLALVDDADVDRIAKEEMKSVVAGKVPVQGTLLGLGDRA